MLFLGSTGVRCGEVAARRVRSLDKLERCTLIAEAAADVKPPRRVRHAKHHQQRGVPTPRFLVDEIADHVDDGTDDYVFAEKGAYCICATSDVRANESDSSPSMPA